MIKTKVIVGPFGPHHAKKMFKYKRKWHFLKWVSAAQLKKEIKNGQKNTKTQG